MGLQSMQGTPWHIETVKKPEDDNRRHKSRCTFYNSRKCTHYLYRCPGSAHCDVYKEKDVKKVYIKKIPQIKSPIGKGLLYGSFEVLFLDDGEKGFYEIGKNIKREAPLTQLVANNEQNSIVELNCLKIRILKKNMYFKV